MNRDETKIEINKFIFKHIHDFGQGQFSIHIKPAVAYCVE
jgi:hypothetical protein